MSEHPGRSRPARRRTVKAAGKVCPCCGRDIASVDREVRFGVPDVFMALSDEERDERQSHRGENFMRLAPDRFFVRGLLPVRLSDGHEFRFGVWLEINSETCVTLMSAWDEAEYASTVFDGQLANAVPPWGQNLLDKPCQAGVRDRKQLPFIRSSTDIELHAVLSTLWPRSACEELVADVWDRPGSRG